MIFLKTFFQRFLPEAVGQTFTHVQVNGGGNNQSDPGVEANLDIQYTEGLTQPTPNIYFSTGGSPPFIPDDNTPTNTNEPYLVSGDAFNAWSRYDCPLTGLA